MNYSHLKEKEKRFNANRRSSSRFLLSCCSTRDISCCVLIPRHRLAIVQSQCLPDPQGTKYPYHRIPASSSKPEKRTQHLGSWTFANRVRVCLITSSLQPICATVAVRCSAPPPRCLLGIFNTMPTSLAMGAVVACRGCWAGSTRVFLGISRICLKLLQVILVSTSHRIASYMDTWRLWDGLLDSTTVFTTVRVTFITAPEMQKVSTLPRALVPLDLTSPSAVRTRMHVSLLHSYDMRGSNPTLLFRQVR
jgi:hypothetical protein